MRQKTFDFFYATGIWFINGRQGIKIGWGLALEWALGLNPPFRLCITSQGVDDTQPKGRQMGKHIVSTCQINPLILPRRPRPPPLFSTGLPLCICSMCLLAYAKASAFSVSRHHDADSNHPSATFPYFIVDCDLWNGLSIVRTSHFIVKSALPFCPITRSNALFLAAFFTYDISWQLPY